MDERAVLDELRDLIVKRLRFDAKVVSGVSPETPLPKGVEGALGLDSLDFIELSIALEERFGVVVQEGEAVEAHFATLGALARYVAASQSRPS
jgi:acyl carrier protein